MRRFFVLSYSLRNMTAADIKCESTSDLSLDTLARHSRLDRESPYKASISSLVNPVNSMISSMGLFFKSIFFAIVFSTFASCFLNASESCCSM